MCFYYSCCAVQCINVTVCRGRCCSLDEGRRTRIYSRLIKLNPNVTKLSPGQCVSIVFVCVCVSILCAGRPSFSFHFMTFDCVPLKNRYVCHCSFLIFSLSILLLFFALSIKELNIFTLHSVGNFDNLCTMKLKINSTFIRAHIGARKGHKT